MIKHSIVRLPKSYLLKTYNGKCLIQSYSKDIAFWLSDSSVSLGDEFFEFAIDSDKMYTASYIHSLENKPQHQKSIYSAKDALTFFDMHLALGETT